MIPARYSDWVFVFFMTLCMGLALSFFIELFEEGPSLRAFGQFLVAWLRRFLGTYVLVVPTVIVVTPLARRITALLVSDEDS